jgi:uncharacterized surface protein with fasciclin (FAS1) repeats
MIKLLLTLIVTVFTFTSLKSENHTVNTGAYYYSPEILTINVGDQVTWINDGGLHDVNADENTQTGESFNNPESFQSNTTNVAGATIYTHTFTIPGTYNYDCSVGSHAAQGMVGQIIVQGLPSIMDIVTESVNHSTLEAAINAAELNETLDNEGTFTLFAPTDEAFEALPEGTVAGLLEDIPALTEILLHHVVGNVAMAADLINDQLINTLNETELTVSIDGMTYMIDMATVTTADISASNGVVHVIDIVLIPANPTGINEQNNTELYMYSLNLLGEKVDINTSGELIFDIYTNGKIVKKIKITN